MKILGIETSSSLFSLCVHEDEHLLYEIRKDRQLSKTCRDAELFAEANNLLELFHDDIIEVIALGIGPGMFTTLRVGLALAKGLALTRNIPVVVVNTLDVIGIPLSFPGRSIIAVINAYHDEVYEAFYQHGKRVGDYRLTSLSQLIETVEAHAIIAGPGMADFIRNDKKPTRHDIHLIVGDVALPSASKVVRLSLPKIKAADYEPIDLLEPFYIKKTDAERNYHKTDAL